MLSKIVEFDLNCLVVLTVIWYFFSYGIYQNLCVTVKHEIILYVDVAVF